MSRVRIEKIVFLPRNVHFDSKYLVLSQSLMNSQTCKDAFSASLKVSEIRIRRALHELQFSTIISLFFCIFAKAMLILFLKTKQGVFRLIRRNGDYISCLFDKRSWSWDFYSVYRLLKKLKRKLSFLFVGKGKLFIIYCSSRNSTLFSSLRSAWPVLKWRIWRYTFHSMVKEITFLRGNLCICKCFVDF